MFGLISLWSARDDAFGPGKPGTMQTAGATQPIINRRYIKSAPRHGKARSCGDGRLSGRDHCKIHG